MKVPRKWRELAILIVFSPIVLVAAASSLRAEFRFNPTVYGDWSLYPIDNFSFPVNGKRLVIRGACVAETIHGKYKFTIATAAAEFNRGNDDFADRVMLEATSSAWRFKVRVAAVVLSSQAYPELALGSAARYDGNLIFFSLGGSGKPPAELALFAATATGDLLLFNDRSKLIARFSTKGLRDIYPKLLECGGIH